MIKRKNTRAIKIGNLQIGGGAPIAVQSMTNTKTDDVVASVAQINALAAAGCDIVRLAVPDLEAAQALKQIKHKVNVPLIADIHFDYRLALAAMESGIDALRLNPGNIGDEDRVKTVVKEAKRRHIPIRIGVNAGSLDKVLLAKGLKEYGPTMISCPTCGRCNINLAEIAMRVENKLSTIQKPISVAVMGCIVNGPGEAREADVGIASGRGEGFIFRKGQIIRKVPENILVNELFLEIDKILEED